ncbi:acyl-CoA thioesterase-1 [Desulfuromusa kysingii]|uniref:Acyl-CoA thioesterase-1 n=1 Tax=Desulfuromusa kysingii TaxID=37625 RepID=A0A1H3X4U2_9BACT|nr:acyl-CoA thioesterase-1 [Desulfuromusa kysingii]
MVLLLCCCDCFAAPSAELRIVVLGDSLTAGYGLPQEAAFPARLEEALKHRGRQVRVVNAGVSGDTSMGGLARLDWSLGDDPDLMIVELGANDALRGLSPQQTRENLDRLLARLQQQGVQALLTGMKAPRNMGEDYYTKFDQIYPDLAQKYDLPFYPFFLAGVVGDPELNQADGIHPTRAGVDVIVRSILATVEEALDKIATQREGDNIP